MKSSLVFLALCSFWAAPVFSQDDYTAQPKSDSLKHALANPEAVVKLTLDPYKTQDLDLEDMKHLPRQIGNFVNLRELRISCMEQLEELPVEIGQLRNLEKLIIQNGIDCTMNISVPESIGNLQNLTVLNLTASVFSREDGYREPGSTVKRSARVKKLPMALGNLQNLQELYLSENQISAIPPQIASLRNLKVLALDNNNLRVIPLFVGGMQSLQRLSLSFNHLHSLPENLGDLQNLKELNLSFNRLFTLPQGLSTIKGLRIIMGNNALSLPMQKAYRSQFPYAKFDFANQESEGGNEGG